MKIIASSPTTSWKQMGKQWKQWQTLFSWGPKSLQMVIAAMKLKKILAPWRKAMTNLDSILKSRDIILPTKVCLVKAVVFPVVMYGYESWTIKKAECRRTDAFELWCWRRLLRVPWTARSSNQSILKEINVNYSLEALILRLPYFDAKNLVVGKDPDAGKDWGWEEKGMTEDEMVGWHHHINGHEFEQALGAGNGQGSLACCGPWGQKGLDMTERLNWSDNDDFGETKGLKNISNQYSQFLGNGGWRLTWNKKKY